MMLSAKALLSENPTPTSTDIKHALSGNLCRCGTYGRVMEAIDKTANGGGK